MEVAPETLGIDNVAQGESQMGRGGLQQRPEEHLRGKERKRSLKIV